ncbi:hypothetical protein NDU88_000721, partial [Pleurodeles waltl]
VRWTPYPTCLWQRNSEESPTGEVHDVPSLPVGEERGETSTGEVDTVPYLPVAEELGGEF